MTAAAEPHPVPLASFGRRSLAGLLDLAVVLLISMSFFFEPGSTAALADTLRSNDATSIFVAVGPLLVHLAPILWLYRLALEASPLQATLGKRLLSLRVARPDGQPAGLWRTLLRSVPWLLLTPLAAALVLAATTVLGILGLIGTPVFLLLLLVPFTLPLNARRQRLHDLLARTVVVRV